MDVVLARICVEIKIKNLDSLENEDNFSII